MHCKNFLLYNTYIKSQNLLQLSVRESCIVFPTVIFLKYLHRVKILFHFLRQLERRYVSFILQVGIRTAFQQVMHGRQVISFYRFMQSGIAVGILCGNHRSFLY